jgi:hypothetical protein
MSVSDSRLYLVTLEASPLPGTENADEYGGAFINIYTKDASEAAALETATREIADAGWRALEINSVELVERAEFPDDSEGLAYFDQAQIDGIVIVIHTFGHEADEDTVRH